MFGVTGLAAIENIRRDGRVVGVFLATGFDVSALTWFVDVWGEIHRRSGHRWHLVAPTLRPINDKATLATRENYDVDLAEDLARMYGLSNKELPCIVLDTFNEEERQLRIALPELERDRRKLIEDIDGYLIKSIPDVGSVPKSWSRDLTRSLYDHLQMKSSMKALVALVPKIGSIGARAAGRAF